jgi:hypothetical protein
MGASISDCGGKNQLLEVVARRIVFPFGKQALKMIYIIVIRMTLILLTVK